MKTLKALLNEIRISGRFPTAKKAVESEYNQNLKSDLTTAKRNRKSFEHNMGVLANSSVYKDIDKRKLEGATPDEIAEHYINHFKDNILHIHDNMDAQKRQDASQWYDTAHKIAKSRHATYAPMSNTLTPEGVAGVYAALSPGNEWNNNIALGDRVMHIYHTQKTTPWSEKMEATAKRIWKPKDHPILDAIRGRTLGELDDPMHKAMWIRTHDEAHNKRDHPIYGPDGRATGQRNTSTRWQSLHNISKAVQAIESGGDMKVLSRLMGKSHKVRHFFNNIADPNNGAGDVTIDTHAVAAAHYKPFGQSAIPVNHAFGSSPPAGKKPSNWVPVKSGGATTGINGTDHMYQEAYRRAASERGILPRQMQSIAWEGIRAIFPNKRAAKAQAAHRIWAGHHEGQYSADSARQQIDDRQKEPDAPKKVTIKPKKVNTV
jgi:hypothetical protein